MKYWLYIICSLLFTRVYSQGIEKLSLIDCYKYAMDSYPTAKQKPLYNENLNLKFKELNSGIKFSTFQRTDKNL